MSEMKTVPLGELIKPAKTVKAGENEYPILSMTMHNGLMDQNQKFKKNIASKDLSGYKVVKRGQLVVSFPIDEGVLDFQQLYDEAIVSPAYGIWDVIDGVEVDIDYLGLALRSERSLMYYKAKLQGSTARRRSLPKEVFLALPVELSSLDRQKNEVKKTRLQKQIEQKRQRQRELLGELRKSIFRDMFFNKNYVVKKLDEVAWTSSGSTPKRSISEYYDNGSIPWVKSGDLHKNYILEASEFITETALNETSAKLLEPGAILIAMYGATVGAVSELKISAATNQAVCAIIPKDENLDATYLKYFLISQYDYILGLAVGGAQANISQAIIKNLDIPIPSRQVQENFSEVMKTIDGVR